jgi:hypothetical protein
LNSLFSPRLGVVVDSIRYLASGLAVTRDDGAMNCAVTNHHSDESVGIGFIDRGWFSVSRLVSLLDLKQPFHRVGSVVIVHDLVMDIAKQNEVVKPVALLIGL